MCDCFHLAFPNWQAASSGTGVKQTAAAAGAGRRLRAPEPGTEEESICDEPSQFTEGERPRPQGSSPIEEYPETEKYIDSDQECEAEHDPHHKSGKKTKKSGLGSMFEKRSTPKMSKVKEVHSPESGVIVKTAKDGCAEGLVYGGGGKEGIFIKEVVPESPASKNLKLQEGDQILSATVYFDNMSYEDAIQILEHARAYKVKLCLKRKSHITETEPAIECEAIPEEELYIPEMRGQGTTKRRGDARISWPKFPSLGRKSRFTRSHSSSEADEQRKLELSPTTSDTESPVKSQDALKGKKRNKMKLSVLTNRGRISSSEDQDTEAPTSGQISSHQTASDMLSPECLESPSGETLQVYMTEDPKVVEVEQKEPETVQHKVELISIDSTLKTTDLTVALTDQESLSGIKSPGEKKQKKERSELKMKILGKDKSLKKAKSSPKRLKTLGASFEIAEQPENKKSDVISSFESNTELKGDQLAVDANTPIISSESSGVISRKSVTSQMEMSVPKVELDISDVTFICKSQKKGEEKTKKEKGVKQKQEGKICPTFKLPKVSLSDIATEEPIQKINVNAEECTTKIEQPRTEGTVVKEDPYDRLSKSSHSRTQLPKREDIVIPGMEDMSRRTKAKKVKEPKTVFTGHYDEIQAETVQLSIDVDSVKEAVSKLPGFKLPKVDTSGVPIPEEITVIDANAQRISVKTPTKVVDTKTKHEAHFTKFDMTASPQISKTTVKLPKITTADLPSEGLLTKTRVDMEKPEKDYKTKPKQCDKEIKTEVDKREDIIIPGKESAQDAAILKAQEIERMQGLEGIIFEYDAATKCSLSESDKKKERAKVKMPTVGIAKPDIKLPDIGIYLPNQTISEQKGDTVKGEKTIFLQEVKMSKTETMKSKGQIREVLSDVKIPEIDTIEYIDSVGGPPAKKDGGIRITSTDTAKPIADISFPEMRGVVSVSEDKQSTMKLTKVRTFIPDADINIDRADVKPLVKDRNLGITMAKESGSEIDLSFSNKTTDVTLPKGKAEVNLPEAPGVDVSFGNVNASIQEQKLKVEKPALEIKPLKTAKELDGQESKLKMPNIGIKMSEIKGPKFDISSSKTDTDVTVPEVKDEVIFPEAPEIKSVDVSIHLQKTEAEKPGLEIKPLQTEGELDGQGSKFKMPKLGITMSKVKVPEIDVSLSKKDVDVKLPDTKSEFKLPDVELKDPSATLEIKAAKIKGTEKDADGSPSKFKMPTFKLPKFGAGTSSTTVEVPDMDKNITIDGSDINIPEGESAVNIVSPSMDIEGPTIDLKTSGTEQDGKGRRFKMPHLGFSMPQMKGPKIDLNLSNKDADIQLPKHKIDVKLPEAPKIAVEMKPPECEAEMERHSGKFQIPKSEVKLPKVKGPEFDLDLSQKDIDVKLSKVDADVKLPDVDVSIPEAKIDVKKPQLEMQVLQTQGEVHAQGYKIPRFGTKGPEIDLSLPKKDLDMTPPQTEVKTKLPDVPKIDVSLGKAESFIPEANVEIKKPEVQIKPLQTDAELKGKGGKFKMSKFEITMPKIKGPDIDFSLSKKDVDVKLPEAKAGFKPPEAPEVNLGKVDVSMPEAKMEVEKPELENKLLQSERELDGQGSKFKMRKFGISMPKGPEIDFSLSKKDVDVSLPEAEAKVNLPEEPSVEVEIKAPQIESQMTTTKGSPSKFKLPTLKFPKFGAATPVVRAEVPGADKDIKIDGADMHMSMSHTDVDAPESIHFSAPEQKIEVEKPELEIKPLQIEGELDGQGSKFKMPKLGIKRPKVKVPEINVNLSKKDVDVKLPDTKSEVKLPDVELKDPSATLEIKAAKIKGTEKDADGSPSKFKMPTFKLPKFAAAAPNVGVDVSGKTKDIQIPETQLKSPEGIAVDITAPSIDSEGPSLDVKTTAAEFEGKGSKFKIPKLGISVTKLKGPEIDLSSAKKDVDLQLPEVEAEVKLPDVEHEEASIKAEVKSSEIAVHHTDAEGSSSKFKMPTFKLPKFGVSTSKGSVEVPEANKELKIEGADITMSREGPMINTAAPSMDVEGTTIDAKMPESQVELDRLGKKFKMPSLGMTMPKVKGPEIHFGISKKDGDVTLPEDEAEVNTPEVQVKEHSANVEVSAPEIKVTAKDGSPSKFKMPTLKLPKFGAGTSSTTVEVPDMDKNITIDGSDINIPEGESAVNIVSPSMDIEGPTIDLKTSGTEQDGKGRRFKMPHLGFSMPQMKGPKIDLNLSNKDADIQLPKHKIDVKLPEAPKIAVEMKPPECEAEMERHSGKFLIPKSEVKLPKVKGPEFDLDLSQKDIDVKLSKVDADVKLPDVDVSIPEAKIDVKKPQLEMQVLQTQGEVHAQGYKIPRFGIKGPEIDLSLPKKDLDMTPPQTEVKTKLPDVPKIDVSLGKAESFIPEANVEIKKPEVQIKPLQTDAELKGKGGKFKMSKFEITMPKIKGPDIDFSLSKKDVDVKLPEAKAGFKPPEAPEVNLGKVDVSMPEAKMEVEKPELENKLLQSERELDGQGSKFKMRKFGISMPKGPEIDFSLSKKDVDVSLPEAEAKVNLPEEPSVEVEIKAPQIESQMTTTKGSPSKFKLPTLKFPKFGAATPVVRAEVPGADKDIKIDGADMHMSMSHTDVDAPEVKTKVHLPEVEVKEPSVSGADIEAKLKKSRFSLPKLSKPSIKVPEGDVSLQDVNVAMPEEKTDVKGGVDIKPPEGEAEVDSQGRRFTIPMFGIKIPKVTGPEVDVSLSKTDVDVTLPEATAEVKLPDVEVKQPSAVVEIKTPEITAVTKDKETSPSKFKMPTFKLPKFGVGTTSVTAEIPDTDKDIKIDGADITIPEQILAVNIKEPSIEGPSVDMKTMGTEHDGKGGKFKLPSLGFSMSKRVHDPDFNLSKTDVDVTLPEATAEIKLPDVEVKQPSAQMEIKTPEITAVTKDKETSPSKFKMPTFKLPKFGVGTTSVTAEIPDMDKDIKIDGADITIPEEVLSVSMVEPSIEGPSVEIKTTVIEQEGKGGKFKLPSLGFSASKVKGQDTDLNLSKTDVDVTLPEATAKVKLPDVEVKQPSAVVEIKAPEITAVTKDKETSPSKFKMPTFKLPKFGAGTTSVTAEIPDMDKDIKIDGADITIPEEVLSVSMAEPSIEGPSVEIKTTVIEQEGKGGKFKLPSLGFSASKVKGQDTDLNLSKTDVDVTLPEATAKVKLPDVEVKQPSAVVEIKAPEITAVTKDKETSPSKFKMPTFKLPKFGVGTTSVTAEIPDTDKDIKIDGADITIPEQILAVNIKEPSIEGPSVDMKTMGTEHDGKGGKFKLPSLGFSMSKRVHDPDFNLSKTDVDVTLPEATAEIKLPDVEVKQPSAQMEVKTPEITAVTKDKETSPSKFKMPTFKLPKFGVGTTSVTAEIPDMDKDIKIDGADITIPEEVLSVSMVEPSIEGPSVEIKTTVIEQEGKGGKFKLPSLGFSASKVKGQDTDLNLSKTDVDVTLPEATAKVKLPDVEVKQPSAVVEIKTPEIKAVTKDKETSPSKFKMPTFKLPKFGVGTTSVTAEIPDMDKDIKIDGADITIPEEVLSVSMAEPSIEGPSVEIKTTVIEQEGKGGKFKLPSLGFSASKVKGQDTDLNLSKRDVDVTLPEATAKVKLPDVEVKQPSAVVEIKAPEIKAVTKDKERSPSKFKMPTFKLPKFGAGTTSVTAEIPDMDKDIKIDGADITIPEQILAVNIEEPSIEGPSVDMKTMGTEHDGKGGKFKLPSLGFSASKVKGQETDLNLSKTDIDVRLPEATAEVKLPDVKVKQPSVEAEIKTHVMDVQTSNVEGAPSKFKLPTLKLPRFGTATPQVSVEVPPDMDKDIKHYEAKLKVPKEAALVGAPTPSIGTKELSVDVKAKGSELERSGGKFKLAKIDISLSKDKAPETGLSLSKIDPSVKIPEAKADVTLPSVEVKEPEVAVTEKDAHMVEVEDKLKRPNWTFPKFSFSRTGGKAPDIDVKLETPTVDVASAETKAEVYLPGAEVKGPSGGISLEKPPAVEVDANLRKPKFSLPTFSFSKSTVKEPEVSTEHPHVDVSIQEGEVLVKQPEMEIEAPDLEVQRDGQRSKFKLPKFGTALTKSKGPEVDLNASQKDMEVKLPEVKTEVNLPEGEVKESSTSAQIKVSETEAKSKDIGGSPIKFKMPTLKMPIFGGASYDVIIKAPDAAKAEAETDEAQLKEDVTVSIKDQSTDIKTEVSTAAVLDSEMPKPESDGVSHGSPSKFKLPSFKMPKLIFSKPKPEDEHAPVATESKEDQLEMDVESKGETTSPKLTLGEILNYIDVEFDVPKADKADETLETSKEIHERDEPSGKLLEAKKKETDMMQVSTKSPESKGWFQFPKFGLSSPSEVVKVSDKDKHKDEKSPVGETGEEESPTCSIQSSDAFADISSTMTSEHIGLSLSSPTKVTVKYSDPNAAAGLGEVHSNIITSTTRTETISVEPNLPEKITILSSGVSSSSEDTLRLQSGKIHVITSNIQATPEAHHAKLLTAVQVQSAESLPLKSEATKAVSWTVEDSQSGRTVFEKHLIRETSSERSETIVITKQVTRTFDSSEPISGETASSIQRLRDSVHSEKMKFFDGAEK